MKMLSQCGWKAKTERKILISNWKCISVDMLDFHFSLHNSSDLTDELESFGLLVDYCDVLSGVRTLILTAPIHYRGSIDKQVMYW